MNLYFSMSAHIYVYSSENKVIRSHSVMHLVQGLGNLIIKVGRKIHRKNMIGCIANLEYVGGISKSVKVRFQMVTERN